jgi:hypothetical protein
MAGYDRWRGPDAAQFLVGIHDGEELFVVWCKKEQDSLYNEIEGLESGRLRTYSLIGAARTDTTDSTIRKLKAKLAELDALLTKLDELP